MSICWDAKYLRAMALPTVPKPKQTLLITKKRLSTKLVGRKGGRKVGEILLKALCGKPGDSVEFIVTLLSSLIISVDKGRCRKERSSS